MTADEGLAARLTHLHHSAEGRAGEAVHDLPVQQHLSCAVVSHPRHLSQDKTEDNPNHKRPQARFGTFNDEPDPRSA